MKLKLILPLAQMGLAALLLRLSFLYEVAARMQDSRDMHPGFVLLLLLNLPVSVPVKMFLYGLLPTLWFDALMVVTIGVFWYWAALRMLMYRERGTLLPFNGAWMRISIDLLLVSVGVFLLWSLVEEVRDYPFMFSPSRFGWPWFVPICASSLVWSLGSILVFGYDLANCVRHRCRENTSRVQPPRQNTGW
jgi:hypothetical protein